MPTVAPISRQIWDMKYRLRAPSGEPLDGTVEDSWRRIATALAVPEPDPAAWVGRFFEALEDFQFLPAGRIVAGAGSKRKVTLFNCFVMGPVADDMAGIFESLKEAALTMQQGGGIGIDFTEVGRRDIPNLLDAPAPGEFCPESKLGTSKADLVIGLYDRRVLALECKVSNSEVNSVKRVNREAAQKARAWINDFGQRHVVPGAVLGGVFKPDNLATAQAEGLALFWSHRLVDLRNFIEATQ